MYGFASAELEQRRERFQAVGDLGVASSARYWLRWTIAASWAEELQPCGTDPVTGFYRDGCCRTGAEDRGSHTICAVVTAEFLEHQRSIGNDLSTPMPQYDFPGLVPGDRWCVTAANWLRAHEDGAAAYVVLASTHERALEIVPLDALEEHAVDVPADRGPSGTEPSRSSSEPGWRG